MDDAQEHALGNDRGGICCAHLGLSVFRAAEKVLTPPSHETALQWACLIKAIVIGDRRLVVVVEGLAPRFKAQSEL